MSNNIFDLSNANYAKMFTFKIVFVLLLFNLSFELNVIGIYSMYT